MKNLLLLLITSTIFAVGTCGGPLIMRLYYLQGGKRLWFTSWLEIGGFPIIIFPLTVAYFRRRKNQPPISSSPSQKTHFFTIKPRLFMASAGIGILTGLDCYLYSYGVSKLPVSTSSLIVATQLVFTAMFAFLLVKQKFTFYSVNAVALLTVATGVLAMHTNSDKPKNVSNRGYILGFLMTLAASVLYGLMMPLVELAYMKARQKITFALVLETQLVMCLFATGFCTVGMLANNDFKAVAREAKESHMGEAKYYLVAVFSAILWQFNFLGAIGVVFCASSLVSGIVLAILLPISEVLAVIFYHENFQADKGVSLILSLLGFVSYFYGEMKEMKNQIKTPKSDPQQETSKVEPQPKSSQTEMQELPNV
ncbi:purine permease 3-like isoform X1 [Carica papaya]|uniref:purine permease 3-like isoform X1 n=1 Tax=Carica papaya TaxID=3649 RepID=UPI000B8CA8F6|nr:purine permease 3-like isoform X1 [Carica papaya]